MAVRYPITLNVSEPNNNIGLLKIRQADEETQTLVVQILEDAVPKSYEGLQVFFCARIGQTAGLGIIEQKLHESEMTDPKNGKLEYTFRAEDWQVLGRQNGYFSFRKMEDDHTYIQQFSTRDFTFEVTKSVYSDGIKEVTKDGSTYVWTFEDLLRLFKEFIASGKSDWEEFVEQNKEIIESVDPGGKLLKEVIEARKPENEDSFSSLGERLNLMTKHLDEKAYQVATIAEMKAFNFSSGDLVETSGYYEKNDGGGAIYQILDSDKISDGGLVHDLANGLKAIMVIRNETVDVRQFGAKPDYNTNVTDNYQQITQAISASAKVTFGDANRYFISKQLVINKDIEIDGKGSYLYSEQGLMLETNTNKKIKINRLKIVNLNLNKQGIGVEVRNTDQYLWGAHVMLSDTNIAGFNVGFKGDALFANQLTNMIVSECNIAYAFSGKNHLSNQNENHRISALDCKIGLVLENTRNTHFTLCTFEKVDRAIICTSDCLDIKFDTCWFEVIREASCTFGSINLDTLSITEDKVANPNIYFNNLRFYSEGYSDSFFSNGNKFMASYGNYNNSYRYEDNIDNLLLSGIYYKNYANKDISIASISTGTVTQINKDTVFGPKQVTTGIGISGGFYATIPIKKEDILRANHVYLLKVKIYTSKEAVVSMYPDDNIFTENTNLVSISSPGIPSVKEGWIEATRIVKMKNDLSAYTTASIVIRLYNYTGTIDLELTDPVCIDLSEVFGIGNEPDINLNKKIGKYFSYVPQNQYGQTGLAMSLENGGASSERPPRPITRKFFSYFDTTLNKPIWYNGKDWVDSQGTVVT